MSEVGKSEINKAGLKEKLHRVVSEIGEKIFPKGPLPEGDEYADYPESEQKDTKIPQNK